MCRPTKQTNKKLLGNEAATTSPAKGIARVYLIGLLTKMFSAPKPRNATSKYNMKVKMIIKEENSNFDVAHWQARLAVYEHFDGYRCPQKNEIDNHENTPNFLIQDPAVQIKNKNGD